MNIYIAMMLVGFLDPFELLVIESWLMLLIICHGQYMAAYLSRSMNVMKITNVFLIIGTLACIFCFIYATREYDQCSFIFRL